MNTEFEINYKFRSRSIRNEVNQILGEHFVSLGPIEAYMQLLPIELSPTYAQFVIDTFHEISHPHESQRNNRYWITAKELLRNMRGVSPEQEEPEVHTLTLYQIHVLTSEVIRLLHWRAFGLPPQRYSSEEIERLLSGAQTTQNIIRAVMDQNGEDQREWESLMNRYNWVVENLPNRLLG